MRHRSTSPRSAIAAINAETAPPAEDLIREARALLRTLLRWVDTLLEYALQLGRRILGRYSYTEQGVPGRGGCLQSFRAESQHPQAGLFLSSVLFPVGAQALLLSSGRRAATSLYAEATVNNSPNAPKALETSS